MLVYQSLRPREKTRKENLKPERSSDSVNQYQLVHSQRLTRLLLLLFSLLCFAAALVVRHALTNSIRCELPYDYDGEPERELVLQRSDCAGALPTDGDGAPYLPAGTVLGYHLRNFFLTHRNFNNSVRWKNPHGAASLTDHTSLLACSPIVHEHDGSLLIPCGLSAKYAFSDAYTLRAGNPPRDVPLHDSYEDIVDPDGRQRRETVDENAVGFEKLLPKDVFPEGARDPHFLVWMKRTLTNDFVKPYAVLGARAHFPLRVLVQNRFDLSHSSAHKSVVFYRPSEFGTPGMFDVYLLYAVGATLAGAFLLLTVAQLLRPRVSGDIRFLICQE